MSQPKKSRVIVYIDGLNLYHGLMAKGLRNLLWLDITRLASEIVRSNQQLVHVKYFTARVSGPERKRKRQNALLDALETLYGLSIIEGYYQENPIECRTCSSRWTKHEEKMTDVKIAVEMLQDAHADLFDTALLISADSDLVPVIEAIRGSAPGKRVGVAFAPQRFSYNLRESADFSLHISPSKVRRSLLSPRIRRTDGFELVCPKEYWHPSFGPEP